jgi:hypothetical protein
LIPFTLSIEPLWKGGLDLHEQRGYRTGLVQWNVENKSLFELVLKLRHETLIRNNATHHVLVAGAQMIGEGTDAFS